MAVMATSKAAKQKATFGRRAWRLLRLAVLWARRGSAMHSLRLLNTLRRTGLGGGGRGRRSDLLRYGEREYSIEETPAFRFRTPSAIVLHLIPCIAPSVPDTPGVYGDDRYFFCRREDGPEPAECSIGYYNGEPSDCGHYDDEISCGDGAMDEPLLERAMMEAGAGAADDAGVDVKAEEFIAKFYAQMKLQRQISWLQYNEMMERSIC